MRIKEEDKQTQQLLIEAATGGELEEVLASLKRSTKYWWKNRMKVILTLCTWAAWRKAKANGIITPTYEGIWGSAGLRLFNYQNTRTGEMVTATEHPKGNWEFVSEVTNNAASSTSKISGVALTALAVNQVLKDELGDRVIKELLTLLPIVGPYAPDIWNTLNPEKLHLLLTGEGFSLRNLNRKQDPEEIRVMQIANHFLSSDSVNSAIRALSKSAPLVSPEYRVQPSLDRQQLETDLRYGVVHELPEELRPKSDLKRVQ